MPRRPQFAERILERQLLPHWQFRRLLQALEQLHTLQSRVMKRAFLSKAVRQH
jgi:hypothetical protein